jgi:S-adenosylmethionine/arginine decarboxylase-like enzyme
MLLDHKHLIVRATTNKFPKDTTELEEWLKALVGKIGMKLAKGIKHNPSVYYCDMIGNAGLTGFAIIETSHIAIHIWNEVIPYLVQFDIYSCSDFNLNTVFEHFECFDPVTISYQHIDRNKGMIQLLKEDLIIQCEPCWKVCGCREEEQIENNVGC